MTLKFFQSSDILVFDKYLDWDQAELAKASHSVDALVQLPELESRHIN